jgi:thymidylate kinase
MRIDEPSDIEIDYNRRSSESIAVLNRFGFEGTRAYIASRLFKFLEEHGLAYCAVGDTRGWPHHIGSDVDLVIESSQLTHLPRLLDIFCHQNGIRLVQCLQHESTAFFYVLGWRGPENQLLFLQIDVCADYYRNGRYFLSASEMLSERLKIEQSSDGTGGYFVPTARHAFLYYLVKKIEKGSIDERQGSYLSAAWATDPKGGQSEVERFFSGDLLKAVVKAASSSHWTPIEQALPLLRNALHRRLRQQRRSILPEIVRHLDRYGRPTGVSIAFLGPDGSGKSSVVRQCLKDLLPAFRETYYVHLRPRVGFSTSNAVPVTNPHQELPRSVLHSAAKLFYYLADFWVGFLLKTRPRMVRSTLVIFDRYYHDLLVDPLRYRFGGPPWLAQMIGKVIPRPDLWILLDAPAEILRARKQEVSLEESTRARSAYGELIRQLPNARKIDASRDLTFVVAEAQDAILSYMANRTRARLKLGSVTDSLLVTSRDTVRSANGTVGTINKAV